MDEKEVLYEKMHSLNEFEKSRILSSLFGHAEYQQSQGKKISTKTFFNLIERKIKEFETEK